MKCRKSYYLMFGVILMTRMPLSLAADAEKTPATMPEVVVTGRQDKKSNAYNPSTIALPKYTGPLVDTPQSITVIPAQVMKDQGITTLRDALRNVSGISLSAGEGGNQGDSLTIRGFTARSDFFLDGMRDFGSYFRDPFNLEKVEVLKGPASIAFGRGSTGGVVNQESKTPRLKALFDSNLVFGSDLTKRITVDLNRPVPSFNEHTAFRINAMVHENKFAERDVVENRRFGIAPSVAFGLGTPTTVTVNYLHQAEDDIPDYGIPFLFNNPAPVERDNYYGFKDGSNFLRTDVDIVTAKLKHEFNEHFTLRNQIRFANYARQLQASEPKLTAGTTPATALATITVDRNQLTANSVETSLNNDVNLTAEFKTFGIEHTLVSGVEVVRETSDPIRATFAGVPTTSLLNPNPDQPFAGVPTVTTRTHARTITVAPYVVDSLKIGKRLDIIGGFRWDRVEADSQQTIAPVTSFDREDEAPSWRASVVFKPAEQGSVYFNYGTSFNSSAEQISLAANTADLEPEKTRTFEFGTKWELFRNRLSLTGALFRSDKTNARTPDPANATLNVLTGKQKVEGFELGAVGEPIKNWQILTGYSFLKSKVLSSNRAGEYGEPLANTPKHTFNLWTTYEFPWRLQIGAGVRALSKRSASPTPDATTGLTRKVPGYVTVEAMAKYKITKNIEAQLNAYNLTNKYYIDGVHPAHLIPGAGRTFLVTTNFKF